MAFIPATATLDGNPAGCIIDGEGYLQFDPDEDYCRIIVNNEPHIATDPWTLDVVEVILSDGKFKIPKGMFELVEAVDPEGRDWPARLFRFKQWVYTGVYGNDEVVKGNVTRSCREGAPLRVKIRFGTWRKQTQQIRFPCNCCEYNE